MQNSTDAASAPVLVCDPDPAIRRLMRAALGRRDRLNMMEAEALESAYALAPHCISAVVAVGPGGEAAVTRLRAAGLKGALIATLGHGSVSSAVACMRAGADDVVLKPLKAEDVVERLLRGEPVRVERRRSCREEDRPAATGTSDFCGFLGRSAPMRALYDRVQRVAASNAPVFVTGESGTGKDLCAQAVHARSPRHGGRFVALNCGAIPRELMESEVFGHARGAFTGAVADRAGAAEIADGGTLFLDEIGEMDLALQTKLLRFLQDGKVRRIGEGHERQVDVRIVCATNRDPAEEVRAGRLREDLFYRLHVLELHMPPLRERGDDVMLLAETFLARFAGEERRPMPRISPDAARVLQVRSWRGNVRELQNLMRRIVVLADGPHIPVHLALEGAGADEIARFGSNAGNVMPLPMEAAAVEPLAITERRAIERAIATFGGNISAAAAALELSPSTLYRKRLAWQCA
ncbi:sigma-54 dependent transcriptional regulator [Xanthobacter pseudotagetidis]|uniref:sigma-54 dependent transcriptional regulator n=1 Tax=Xanthobacter pseudotagetidis TaxID=3119911 RepID=UPI003727E0D6